VALNTNRIRAWGPLAALLATGLALGGSAVGQAWNGPTVTRVPAVQGALKAGQTVTAGGYGWNGPSGTSIVFQWLRCTDPSNIFSCQILTGQAGSNYKLTNDDVGKRMRVALIARHDNDMDYGLSNASPAVSAASVSSPAPTPTPVPNRTPTPVPNRTPTPQPSHTPAPPSATATPQPSTATPTPTPTATPEPPGEAFDVAAVPVSAPVNTSTGLLQQTTTSKKAKLMRPFPTIRVQGKLTADGARVTSMTVKAPRGVSIGVSCAGSGCKRRTFSRKSSVTHLSALQHVWKAGTRMTIKISMSGYVSKVTVLTIRRGAAPSRSDGCMWPGHKKTQRCPGD
jgi:hypothetical protein